MVLLSSQTEENNGRSLYILYLSSISPFEQVIGTCLNPHRASSFVATTLRTVVSPLCVWYLSLAFGPMSRRVYQGLRAIRG